MSVRQQHQEDAGVRVEDYLDQVMAPLIGTVPYERRRELRAELAAHLDALVEIHTEMGAEPKEAVAAALEQFGNPRKLGSQWLGEWRPKGTSPIPAMLVGLACFVPATVCAIVLHKWLEPIYTPVIFTVLVTAFPIAFGFLTGLLARHRQATGTLFAVMLCSLISGIIANIEATSGGFDAPVGFPVAGVAILQVMFWAPLGSMAAMVGGLMRRRIQESERPARLA